MPLHRNLHLASPNMHGKDVKALQKALSGDNRWKKNFNPGKADGGYGHYTSAAVLRAKFFMGYPKRKVNGAAGPRFDDLLSGRRTLSLDYRMRQKRRMKRSSINRAMRAGALRSALLKVGLAENPQGSNRNLLTRWWFSGETAAPWCAISVSNSYIQHGSKAFVRGKNYAYVPFMETAAAQGDKGLARVSADNVRGGDVVTFDFNGGVADHVGIFSHWVDKHAGLFEAIEGNTDAAGGAEGGQQLKKERPMSQVSQFIRVLK